MSNDGGAKFEDLQRNRVGHEDKHLTTDPGDPSMQDLRLIGVHEDGAHLIRFCFAKRTSTLDMAAERLRQLRD